MTPWKLQQQTQTNRPTDRPTDRPTNQPTNKPTNQPTNKQTNKQTRTATIGGSANNEKKRPKVLGGSYRSQNLTEENYRNSIQRLSIKADGCVLTTEKSFGIEDTASAFVELVPLELVEAPASFKNCSAKPVSPV